MLWDDHPSAGPGAYGIGLSKPIGSMAWLPEMQGPVLFR